MSAISALYEEVKNLHQTHQGLQQFCAFPSDTALQSISPFDVPARALMCEDLEIYSTQYGGLCRALVDAAPFVIWRETYKGTDIGDDFMARFGCYEIIGWDAPFRSKQMRSFVVYQPAGLHYPWHHHPAEELYVVLGGEGEFHLQGASSKTLGPGACAFHPSGRPHALTCHEKPVLAYVAWRNHFDVPPFLTERG